ncbi:hypothetical protein [Nocardia sp. NPDC049526]|uniref:hypothetical protein n=1 Tax=Nocardia sp. NPDC049526 TaxID=3364316 RepID=UPI00379E2388
MSEDSVGGGPAPGMGNHRGAEDILLALLTGSVLAPFVQAIVTKTGEDTYKKVRELLSRARRNGSAPESGQQITLADAGTAVVLQLPATMTVDHARALATVRVPRLADGQWLLVRQDPESRTWRVDVVAAPPEDAVELDGPHA